MKKLAPKIAYALFVMLFIPAFLLLAAYLISGAEKAGEEISEIDKALDKMCGTQPGFEVMNPEGKYRVVVYGYDCGAISQLSTQISVIPSKESYPTKEGNVFVATGGGRQGEWLGPYVEVVWQSSTGLLIRHNEGIEIHRHENQIDGVSISYETVP